MLCSGVSMCSIRREPDYSQGNLQKPGLFQFLFCCKFDLVLNRFVINARFITYFGNFVFLFFHHFGCVIFFMLNFLFAHLALQNAYIKKK